MENRISEENSLYTIEVGPGLHALIFEGLSMLPAGKSRTLLNGIEKVYNAALAEREKKKEPETIKAEE